MTPQKPEIDADRRGWSSCERHAEIASLFLPAKEPVERRKLPESAANTF